MGRPQYTPYQNRRGPVPVTSRGAFSDNEQRQHKRVKEEPRSETNPGNFDSA